MSIDREQILDALQASPLWGQVALLAWEHLEGDGDYSELAVNIGSVVDAMLPFRLIQQLPASVREAAETYDGPVATFLADLVIDLVKDDERMAEIKAFFGTLKDRFQEWHQGNVDRRQTRRADRRERRDED